MVKLPADTARNSWWECAARFPEYQKLQSSTPVFRPAPLKSTQFSDLGQKLCHHYLDKNANKNIS